MVLPMWTILSPWSKQSHCCSCQGCQATNHTGTLRNLLNPASGTYTNTCRNSPEPFGTFQDLLEPTFRNLPEPSSGTYTSIRRNSPQPSGTFRNLFPPEPAPATCTSAHRSLSGLKTPLAYAVGELGKNTENTTSHAIPADRLSVLAESAGWLGRSIFRSGLLLRSNFFRSNSGSFESHSRLFESHLSFENPLSWRLLIQCWSPWIRSHSCSAPARWQNCSSCLELLCRTRCTHFALCVPPRMLHKQHLCGSCSPAAGRSRRWPGFPPAHWRSQPEPDETTGVLRSQAPSPCTKIPQAPCTDCEFTAISFND